MAKKFVCLFGSLLLFGCANPYDVKDEPINMHTLRERIEDLELEKRCHIGQEPSENCDSQFHWGGSPYYRIERIECRLHMLDGGSGAEYCL